MSNSENMNGEHKTPCDCLICKFCGIENPIPQKYVSKLPLNHMGNIPNNRQSTFYRVEDWKNGWFVADFGLKSEADRFAIEDAKSKGFFYDHKVSRIVMTKTNDL